MSDHSKTIAQLETKLKRQTEAVIATQDLINTLKGLITKKT